MVSKFVSIAVEIEAAFNDGDLHNVMRLIEWSESDPDDCVEEQGGWAFLVETLEGDVWCSPGSWLIKGTEGEFYPCKDSVFKRKYRNA